MATTSSLVTCGGIEHPEFAVEPLRVDGETARAVVLDALDGLSATGTDEGIKVRTTDGTLIAILTNERPDEPSVELHYRIAPVSETATRKAGKLCGALRPYGV
jgi:hypothetical protein